MATNSHPDPPSPPREFDAVWRDDRAYVQGMATRMLGDAAEAEDIVQEAFARLARVDLDEIDDTRGWLAVVVRRLSLDRIRSAHARRESTAGTTFADASRPLQSAPGIDPADRVTLDDQVQLALAIVLDRLTPAERTAFVLHDVFGLPFEAVSEICGRTPTACRQLASRARRSIRAEPPAERRARSTATTDMLTERFIAACAGGDLDGLVELLDPDVSGDAVLIGRGPLLHSENRAVIAQRILGFFGPSADAMLVPLPVEHDPGFAAFVRGRLDAVVRLESRDGRVGHISAFVLPLA